MLIVFLLLKLYHSIKNAYLMTYRTPLVCLKSHTLMVGLLGCDMLQLLISVVPLRHA